MYNVGDYIYIFVLQKKKRRGKGKGSIRSTDINISGNNNEM